MLLKERTLDEAPRPPKKAMDYSSSSEEVESSEDDEEESNGEPSEGSRDAPGARYGGDLGVGTLPHQRHPERRVAGVGEGSGVSVKVVPLFPEVGILAVMLVSSSPSLKMEYRTWCFSLSHCPFSRGWASSGACLQPAFPRCQAWVTQK